MFWACLLPYVSSVQCVCTTWPIASFPALQFFQHYLLNGTIFENELSNIKCVLWYSLQLLCETFLIQRRIERDMIIYVYRSSCKVPLLCDVVKLETYRQIFEKCWDIKFHENESSGSRFVPCGRTDRHDEVIIHFSQFTDAPKNWTFCPHSVFMYFEWIWEQTAIIFLYSINFL